MKLSCHLYDYIEFFVFYILIVAMKIIKLLLLCLLTSCQTILFGQSLKGKVVDQDNKPMEWATISLINFTDSTLITGKLTDVEGDFLFEEILEDKIIVRADFVGYSPIEQVILMEKDVDMGTIMLKASVTLTEVVIKGTKPKISYRDGTLVFDISELENIGSSGMEILRTVPLLQIDKDDNLLVRGLSTKVLINGQDLNLSGDELKTYLDALDTDDISRVEVISNPSSKYEAEGTGGIINIILKKKELGYFSSLYARVGYGDFPKYMLGASVSYFTEKLGVSASIYPGYSKSQNRLSIDRTNKREGSETKFRQTNNWLPINKWVTGNLSLNYKINNKSSLSTFFKSSFDYTEDESFNQSRIEGLGTDSLSLSKSGTDYWNTNTVGINYQNDLDTIGKNLSVEYLRISASNDRNQERSTQFFNNQVADTNPFDLTDSNEYGYSIHSAKVDYSQPFAHDFFMETGLKFSNIASESNLSYLIAQEDQEYILLPLISNTFSYGERNYAAYINSKKTFKKLSLRAGLRMEYTQLETLLKSDQNLLERDNYLQFFPSLGLNYGLKEGSSISWSYSRRLTRPYYKDLNPSIDYIDQYSYEIGNPMLRPEFANIMELGYQLKSTVISAYATISNGTVGEVLLLNEENSVIVTTKKNLNSTKSIGLSFNTSFDLFKKINASFYSAGGYTESVFKQEDILVNQHAFSTTTYLGLRYSFAEHFNTSLSGSYVIPGQMGLFKINHLYNIDLGLGYNKNNLNISFSWGDIFRTSKLDSTVRYGNLNAHWINRWETGIAYLKISYKFGNSNAKKKGDYKKDKSTEEGKRIAN